ncbi:restriction endonuclease subunit S [Micromonospora sp. DT68]|uniref:restriction endonuclease subunit S n=1 Tax=Micromonospora sp. DT68 TaxID=3416522 RepID=UPI003CF0469D
MSRPAIVPLWDLLTEVKPGYACGEEVEDGILQIRMNNVTRDGRLDLSRRRLVPRQSERMEKFSLRPGDVLFNATNSPDLVGKAALFTRSTEAVFSNHFFRLRVDEAKVLPGYLTRWLQMQFLRGVFKSMCQQWVNQATVSRDALLRLSLPLPALGQQRRITEMLDCLDNLSTKQREAQALLDELERSAFLDMFGDPFANPHGFPECELAELVSRGDRINYGVVQPGGYDETGVPMIRVGDLADGGVDRSVLKRISSSIEGQYYRSRIRGNEILVSCVGSIGSVSMVGPKDVGSNIARAVARVPLDDDDTRQYLMAYLRTKAVQDYFVRELRTVSQPTLNIKQIAATRVLVPPPNLLRKFAIQAAAANRLKGMHRARLAELDALFASLQDRAFRGEL